MGNLQLLSFALIGLFTLVAAVCDYRTRRIPNWLTLPAFLAAVAYHAAAGGVAGLGFSLAGFAAGFGLMFLLWLFGGSGGGDVKLMGALGAWLGLWMTVAVFLTSSVVVLMLTIAVMMWSLVNRGMHSFRSLMKTNRGMRVSRRESAEKWRQQRQRFRILPYAVPVALSTWIVLIAVWLKGSLAV
jgi:prepilin peptidase CpaA